MPANSPALPFQCGRLLRLYIGDWTVGLKQKLKTAYDNSTVSSFLASHFDFISCLDPVAGLLTEPQVACCCFTKEMTGRACVKCLVRGFEKEHGDFFIIIMKEKHQACGQIKT
jgi:hypothetical protein